MPYKSLFWIVYMHTHVYWFDWPLTILIWLIVVVHAQSHFNMAALLQ